MRVYRAILIPLPRECDVRYIQRLMALVNLVHRGYTVMVPNLLKSIQYQLFDWQRFKRSLVFGTAPKRWLARTWVPLKTYRVFPDGRRIGDSDSPVVLDFMRNIMRVRQVCRNQSRYVVELPMPKWALERVAEGADIKYAMAGLKSGRPYLALIAERDVQQVQPSGYVLVVDVNSWRHGIVYAVINPAGRVAERSTRRPNLRKVDTLYARVLQLERKYGVLKRLGLRETPEGKKLWREVRRVRRKLHAHLKDFAQKLARELALKALRLRAKVIIDDIIKETRYVLLEEKLPRGLAKFYLSSVKRFVEQLVNQLCWYGVPYEFRRLYSTVCPKCRNRMRELPGRIMWCSQCGLNAHRDLIPVMWYLNTFCEGRMSLERALLL
jgi:putative transposase